MGLLSLLWLCDVFSFEDYVSESRRLVSTPSLHTRLVPLKLKEKRFVRGLCDVGV